MSNPSQAELLARSFQSQVARNPVAACLALPILCKLDVVASVNSLCPSDHAVAHGEIVRLLTVNRLQAPRPLYRIPDWLEATGLTTALRVQLEHLHDTRPGETLDTCDPQHQAIWQRVIQRAITRYQLLRDWLPYDITSVYFEGAASGHGGKFRDRL